MNGVRPRLWLQGRHRLPVVLQTEASECGLVCLAMILGAYGKPWSMHELRQRYGASLKGVGLSQLINAAQQLGLTARALRADLEELKQVKRPAILHWDFNHYVVLKKTTRRGIWIHDPAVGARFYRWAEVDLRFTGIVLELRPTFTLSHADTAHPTLRLSDFWSGASGLGTALLHLFGLSALLQLFALLTPFYMQLVVDEILVKQDLDLLTVVTLGFVLLTLVGVLTQLIRGLVEIHLTHQFHFNIGSGVFAHLMRLPAEYFEKRHAGDVISRFEATKPIQDVLTNGVITASLDGVLASAALILMFIYSPKVASIVLGALLVYALFRVAQMRMMRKRTQEQIQTTAKLDSLFIENIRCIQNIKLAAKEADREAIWGHQFARSLNAQIRLGRLSLSCDSVNRALTGLEYVAVIYVGALEVLGGVMTIGMLYAFMSYRRHFSSACLSLIDHAAQYWMIGLHLDRVSDILLTEQEKSTTQVSHFRIPVDGALALKQLSFRYADTEPYVVTPLSLTIQRGMRCMIHGPSGSGKSTLLNLLTGLLTPSQGELLVDKFSLNQLGLTNYRESIAVVSQDDGLMAGSIRDNITFFAPQEDQQRLQQAAEQALIQEDILAMPMGYDSLIGDMGSALSTGQRQRLLIARALYRQPKILFLDEGTAHIDAATEHKIFQQLSRLDLTLIYVSHNPALLQFADLDITFPQQQITLQRAHKALDSTAS